MAEDPRYVVEVGTDGSYLLVDRGPHRDQRVAMERLADANEARQHAASLSSFEELTARLPRSRDPFWVSAEAAASDYTAALEKHHNFNHLLPDEQPD